MRGAASEPISPDAHPSRPGAAGLGAGPMDARLDNDLDKLLMAPGVLQHHPQVEVDFALVNRTSRVRLAELDLAELRRGLEPLQALRLSDEESRALAGLRIGGQAVFPPPSSRSCRSCGCRPLR